MLKQVPYGDCGTWLVEDYTADPNALSDMPPANRAMGTERPTPAAFNQITMRGGVIAQATNPRGVPRFGTLDVIQEMLSGGRLAPFPTHIQRFSSPGTASAIDWDNAATIDDNSQLMLPPLNQDPIGPTQI